MSRVTQIYYGNEHCYTIVEETETWVKLYIHNKYGTPPDSLIGIYQSHKAAEEGIKRRIHGSKSFQQLLYFNNKRR